MVIQRRRTSCFLLFNVSLILPSLWFAFHSPKYSHENWFLETLPPSFIKKSLERTNSLFRIRMRALFCLKAKASYIICGAQGKRKNAKKVILFFMAHCHNALWMDNPKGSQSSSQDTFSIGVRYGREPPTETSARSAVLWCCHPKVGVFVLPPYSGSPQGIHLTWQSLNPGFQYRQRIMVEYRTLPDPVIQSNCSPG